MVFDSTKYIKNIDKNQEYFNIELTKLTKITCVKVKFRKCLSFYTYRKSKDKSRN